MARKNYPFYSSNHEAFGDSCTCVLVDGNGSISFLVHEYLKAISFKSTVPTVLDWKITDEDGEVVASGDNEDVSTIAQRISIPYGVMESAMLEFSDSSYNGNITIYYKIGRSP